MYVLLVDVGNLSRTVHIVDEIRQRNCVKGNLDVLFSWRILHNATLATS